jgi:uncharacterized protein YidB (DUF937 family)
MSLIDDIKAKVGSVLGQGETTDMVNHTIDYVYAHRDGLEGMVAQFRAKGFGDVVNSWISTGKNLPITADQIQSVMGNEKVKAMAQKLGIPPEAAASQLATVLPQLVDKLTPNGQMPAGVTAQDAMNAMRDAASKATAAAKK